MQFANKVSKITLKVVSKEIIYGEIPNCTISSTFLVPLCPTILTDANQFCKIFDTNLKCITSIISNFGLYNSKCSPLLLYIYKVSVLVVFKQCSTTKLWYNERYCQAPFVHFCVCIFFTFTIWKPREHVIVYHWVSSI